MAREESVFGKLTRGEEQASFTRLAQAGVTPELWKMILKHDDVVFRVALALGAGLIRYKTPELEKVFATADPSIGSLLEIRVEFDKPWTGKDIASAFRQSVGARHADVLATLIVGIPTNFDYYNLFLVEDQMLCAIYCRRWEITLVRPDDLFPAYKTKLWQPKSK